MRLLLKIFSRPFLIRFSLILRPLMRFYFKGDKFTDPIDGSRYRKFLPYGYGKKLRKNALCPGTLSLERHRILWIYLTRYTSFLEKQIKVLHIAPAQVFHQKFKNFNNWDYTAVDLYSPLADIKADICNLPLKENFFDLILCNHVLEHIIDDIKAMTELYRVLKKGGTLIAQVPLKEDLKKTYEDYRIKESKIKTKLFGQYDHVRIYGKDFYSRLQSVGFYTKDFDLINKLEKKEINLYGLQDEKIPIAIKKN